MNREKLTKKDILVVCILAVTVWLLAASSLGLLSAGFDCIYSYRGADDFSIIAQTKELLEQDWLWSTDKLGAPYDQQALEYPSICLQIPEYLMMKFWGLFTDELPVVINLQFVFTYALCAVLAYLVLRRMSVGWPVAAAGAVLWALNPYIYERNITHYCLAACYFVPLAVYLCYCCYFDADFLKFDKTILCKRSLLILLMCACIATNGIGYYPFFACFYLCVTALCKLLKTHKWKDLLPAVKTVFLICLFTGAALIPVFLYKMQNPSDSITVRTPADVEVYSLKVTQFFVPLYAHGISWVQDFIDEYNDSMPMVNENTSSYLGVIGCIGFLISILYLFGFHRSEEQDEDVQLLAKLNLAAVLFMSVGGLISLFTVAIRMYSLRGFNRISIFVSFCSIAILCILAQRYCFAQTEEKKVAWWKYVLLAAVLLFGIWEQTPQVFSDGKMQKIYKEIWDSDEAFVNEMEEELESGDMVYQLPYHKYPESGTVNEMNDYQLLAGYIHSDTLKWSYGAMKETKGDRWNEHLAMVDMQSRVDMLIAAGFRGIYIESLAYTDEELSDLLDSIEKKLDYEPTVSEDGRLYFFNLYPYIEKHPEVLRMEALSFTEDGYPTYEDGTDIIFRSKGGNASLYVTGGIGSAEEDFTWTNDKLVEMSFSYTGAKNAAFTGTLECTGILGASQEVYIIVNEELVYSGVQYGAGTITFEGKTDENGIVDLLIYLPNSVTPKELGLSEDNRKLSLQLSSIKFQLKKKKKKV